MTQSVLKNSPIFKGIPADQLDDALRGISCAVRHYNCGETVFHLMDPADHVGIIMDGRVQAQKSFPNGSQVNVLDFGPGDLIGIAAAFSHIHTYPCDIEAAEPAEIMMLRREDVLSLMQADGRILGNLIGEIATATYMLQQRLELFSYSGIAQKAAFYLLSQSRYTGRTRVPIPESMSRWALMMNVSRPSLYRELRRLEGEGIIAYWSPVIVILDPDRLQDVLSR